MSTAERICKLLEVYACIAESEQQLGDAVTELLDKNKISYEREKRLSARDRLDFFIDGTAIELKIDGSWSDLLRQLDRYAESDVVTELVVITTSRRLAAMPASLRDKPVHVAYVGGL